METKIESILLNLIDPNPYQPRESEDPEHVQKIAASIAAEGLMQIPVGRRVGDRVQLAFGHTRLAAYRLLDQVQLALAKHETIDFENDSPMAQVVVQADSALEAGILFSRLPLTIRELTDEDMFRLGIGENVARKDLSPIEESRAMVAYRDTFGKTSAQIGELFGLNESTVRGKLRLLQLPKDVQAQLAKSHVSELATREIVTLFDLPEELRAAAEGHWDNDLKPSSILREALRGRDASVLHEWIGRMIKTQGQNLSSAPWQWDEEFTGDEQLSGHTCQKCPLKIQRDKSTWCLKRKCFWAKEKIFQDRILKLASELTGYPVFDGNLSYATEFRYSWKQGLETAQKVKCPNLCLIYRESISENDHDTLKEKGFPHVAVVCAKRAMNCTCSQAQHAGIQIAAPDPAPAAAAPADDPRLEPVAQPAPDPSIDTLNDQLREQRRQKRQGKEECLAMREDTAHTFADALLLGNTAIWMRLLVKLDWKFRDRKLSIEEARLEVARLLAEAVYSVDGALFHDPTPQNALPAYNQALKEAGLPELISHLDDPEPEPQPDLINGRTAQELYEINKDKGHTLADIFTRACPDCGQVMEEERQDDGWIWLHCKKCDKYQPTEERDAEAA